MKANKRFERDAPPASCTLNDRFLEVVMSASGRLCEFANVRFAATHSLRAMTGVPENRPTELH